MADNTVLNLGTGGDNIATDELTTINGVAATVGLKVQRVKVGFGSDATLRDVDASNGLPVAGAFFQATQPVSGPVTDTQLRATAVPVSLASTTVTGSVAVTGPLTDTQLRASAVPISLATAPTTPVTGTFWQAAQPVTDNAGSLTVDAPVGTPVFVRLSDGVAAIATLPVSLATAPTTPVTGTFWQATQPVSGTVTANAGTGTLAVSLATAPTTPVTGTFWPVTQPVSLAANTPDVTDRAGRLLGVVSEQRAATLHVTATGLVNTAVTASLPAPAAGLFHYITSIQVVKLYAVLGVAAGTGVVVTSTNIPGTPAWTTEQAAGLLGTAQLVINYAPTTPLKSAVAATISTVAAPAQLQTIWRINVSYFTAA